MKYLKGSLGFLAFVAIFTACKKDNPPVYHPPVADAGSAQTIQLPLDSVMLNGTGHSTNGKITGYLWSEISGPTVAVIAAESSPSTEIRALTAGTYVFQFMVIDSAGLTGVDTVSVNVNLAPIVTTTLQPANNPTESYVFSISPTGLNATPNQLAIFAWTENTVPVYGRTYIKFDFSQIPVNSVVSSAKLSLYSMPNSLLGDFVNAQAGTANACYISKVTSAWSNTTLTWNNQPTITATDQGVLPQSTSSFQDETDIDVTNLVKDMLGNSNNGFSIALQNEAIHNIRQFVSSYYADASKHPKLVIVYQAQ